ncbi:hypothetical protein A2U01_0104483, partial [Trifolium medium]|nr:hypothetical protein [Trifolium medium]
FGLYDLVVTMISPAGMWKLEVSSCHLSAKALSDMDLDAGTQSWGGPPTQSLLV